MSVIDRFADFFGFRKLLSFLTCFCCPPDLDLGAFWSPKSDIFILKINIDAARRKNTDPHAVLVQKSSKNGPRSLKKPFLFEVKIPPDLLLDFLRFWTTSGSQKASKNHPQSMERSHESVPGAVLVPKSLPNLIFFDFGAPNIDFWTPKPLLLVP